MAQRPLLTAEQIASGSASTIPFLRLPERASVFADRAARLTHLAAGHPMGDYLLFVARIARLQQIELDAGLPVLPPPEAQLAQARAHGMPPLNAPHLRRNGAWHDILRRILRTLAAQCAAPQARALTKLEREHGNFYEAQANKLLAGIAAGLDTAAAPLIGAALQVYWTHLVTALGPGAFPMIDAANVCPCCGTRPVASIARIGAQESGYRYLHCALCAAEWHTVRIKCAHCDSTRGIHYLEIDGGAGAVKAECCDACGSYLKICYMEKDPGVDPVADDLASVPLDLLVSETGKSAAGVNFMLIGGEAGA
jgi:FdhE protein